MRIRLFGGLELLPAAGDPIRLPTRKTSLTLAALALRGEKGVRRDALAELLWPDRAYAQARSSLRQALTAIRGWLAPQGDGLRLASDAEWIALTGPVTAVDVWLFRALVEGGELRGLTAAADLYRGDVLEGFPADGAFAQWLATHREAERRQALRLCEQLSCWTDLADGKAEETCEGLARRLLASDPTSEEAHRALIRLFRARGQNNAAARQLKLCRAALERELGVEPEATTLALLHGPVGDAPSEDIARPPAEGSAAAGDRSFRPSLVVMPFDNLSRPDDDYFVDGVVEEITAALSRMRDFFVIARQSAFAYKGSFIDVRQIGRELGVSYVVEGTVRRSGDRVRISVQLVDAASRSQIWSDRHEGTTADIFALQDAIAAQVAGAVHPALRSAEIAAAMRKSPQSLQAYDLVLRAFPLLWSHNAEANRRAISTLREAVRADPGYGRAHAFLAWCLAQEVVYLWSADPERDRDGALDAVDQAAPSIEDDPTALTAAGAALSLCRTGQGSANLYLRRALALDPNHAWAWARYGYAAFYEGDSRGAVERFGRALQLSPLDPFAFNIKLGMGGAYVLQGDYALAARLAREAVDQHPTVTWAYRALAGFSELAGDHELAQQAVRKLLSIQPDISIRKIWQHNPMRHVAPYVEVMTEAYRRAGLPEE